MSCTVIITCQHWTQFCQRWPSTHRFTDKFLQHPVQFVPHVVHVLFYIILGVVPLLLQLVLHDHLTLKRTQTATVTAKHFKIDQVIKDGRQMGGFSYAMARCVVTSFSTKRLSMSSASCHCGLFSIGSSSTFVLTLGFLACGGWSDFFSPLPSSVVV